MFVYDITRTALINFAGLPWLVIEKITHLWDWKSKSITLKQRYTKDEVEVKRVKPGEKLWLSAKFGGMQPKATALET